MRKIVLSLAFCITMMFSSCQSYTVGVQDIIDYETKDNYKVDIKWSKEVELFGAKIIEHKYDSFSGTIKFAAPVYKIGEYAFYDSNLKWIVLPEHVETIEAGAFMSCEQLYKITLPASLKKIESGAFDFCYDLCYVTCEATTPPTIPEGLFDDTYYYFEIYVPYSSVAKYKAANGWKKYADRITY